MELIFFIKLMWQMYGAKHKNTWQVLHSSAAEPDAIFASNSRVMVVERMVFNLRYGQEEASELLWKEMNLVMIDVATTTRSPVRIYSGLTGRRHCICTDTIIKSINDLNPLMYYWVINSKIQEMYRQFVTLCDTAQREMYKIEHETGVLKNFTGAITERYTFHLHFGQAKPAIALWKSILEEVGSGQQMFLRMMTDIVGPSYTLLVEATYGNNSDCILGVPFWNANEKMKSLHEKFTTLCHSAELHYLRINYDYR